MARLGLGLAAVLAVALVALGSGADGFAARPLSAQEASPVASPVTSPAATPVDSTASLLATVQAQETATALAATEQAIAAPQQTVSAISTQNAEIQVALSALATREAASAQAASTAQAQVTAAQATIEAMSTASADADATIAALSTAQADSQATIAALTSAQADAQATVSALSTGVAIITATANAIPTATPEPTVTPTPEPTPTSEPQAGDVLYEATGDAFGSWSLSEGWLAAGGLLVFDGMQSFERTFAAVAPWDPASFEGYAVEADIQLVGYDPIAMCNDIYFGVFARGDGQETGYAGGTMLAGGACNEPITVTGVWAVSDLIPFGRRDQMIAGTRSETDNDWHTYRLEVQGNVLRLFVDGQQVAEGIDNRYLTGGTVGVLANGVQLSIRSFRVIAL